VQGRNHECHTDFHFYFILSDMTAVDMFT